MVALTRTTGIVAGVMASMLLSCIVFPKSASMSVLPVVVIAAAKPTMSSIQGSTGWVDLGFYLYPKPP